MVFSIFSTLNYAITPALRAKYFSSIGRKKTNKQKTKTVKTYVNVNGTTIKGHKSNINLNVVVIGRRLISIYISIIISKICI